MDKVSNPRRFDKEFNSLRYSSVIANETHSWSDFKTGDLKCRINWIKYLRKRPKHSRYHTRKSQSSKGKPWTTQEFTIRFRWRFLRNLDDTHLSRIRLIFANSGTEDLKFFDCDLLCFGISEWAECELAINQRAGKGVQPAARKRKGEAIYGG